MITWLFFGSVMFVLFLPQGVEFDEIVLVVAAIAIFSAAYVAEQIRGGLQSINKGQYEAARAMGLTTVQSMSLIILPQPFGPSFRRWWARSSSRSRTHRWWPSSDWQTCC